MDPCLHGRRYQGINIHWIGRESFCQCTLKHCALVVSPVRRLHGVYKQPASRSEDQQRYISWKKWGKLNKDLRNFHKSEWQVSSDHVSGSKQCTSNTLYVGELNYIIQNNVSPFHQPPKTWNNVNLRGFPNFPLKLEDSKCQPKHKTSKYQENTSSLHQQPEKSTILGILVLVESSPGIWQDRFQKPRNHQVSAENANLEISTVTSSSNFPDNKKPRRSCACHPKCSKRFRVPRPISREGRTPSLDPAELQTVGPTWDCHWGVQLIESLVANDLIVAVALL